MISNSAPAPIRRPCASTISPSPAPEAQIGCRRPCQSRRPPLTLAAGPMQDKSGISPQALSSLALVRRLVRDFIWRHAGKIAFAFVCMGIAARRTALRAWLMEPVLARISIARDAQLLLRLARAALVVASVQVGA